MPKYLSPLTVEAEVASLAQATVALTASTLATTPNSAEYDKALYQVDVYVRVLTIDGGTTPTAAINIVFTDNASARTKAVPLATEAGAYAATANLGALGTYSGSSVFRADKNTNIQWSRTAGGTPSNNGSTDYIVTCRRVR